MTTLILSNFEKSRREKEEMSLMFTAPEIYAGRRAEIEAARAARAPFIEKEIAEEQAAAAAKAAKPPVVVRPLPDPMSARTRHIVLGGHKAPEKPDFHGCAYFEGAPWEICYACEYERDSSAYKRSIRHSELVQLISAYCRDTRKGEAAKRWSNEALERIVSFLDTPRASRSFTDEQVCDKDFRSSDYELLAALRALHSL
jgi:hypothetical protein